ncbi:hypothetical protein IEQ34_015114 [Dendrobium chrysotoxum]|uniref:Uncharacterized protein n=1 Tax=Dendrobium chrysotoxum TaxID=161865 RepID=A0AAV7GMH5_DENCH|nr:hypothetical protein IEQ34_015114 [Dendrobium chrysotoxum]
MDASKIIPSAHDGDRRRSDNVASTITSDSLVVIRKKFHVPNDVLIIAPKRIDRAHAPSQGFIAVYEMTLRAGLRFPPAPELLDIFKACGIALPQFLCRAITIIVGLITERSNATQLKKSERVHETTSTVLKHSASHPSEGQRVTNFSSQKKRKTNYKVILLRDDGGSKEAASLPIINLVSLDSDIEARSSRIHIPEDALKHICIERRHANDIDLERQSLEEGFTRGFLKDVWLIHRKTGVDIEGLTPSQASEDSSPNSGDEDIESELKKVFFNDDDDVDIA